MVLAVGQSPGGANIGRVVVVAEVGSIGLVDRGVAGRVTGDNVVGSVGSGDSLDNLLGRNGDLATTLKKISGVNYPFPQ